MILVTGGTGYVGSGVVPALAATGEPLRLLARSAGAAGHLSALDPEIVIGDVTDPATLAPALDGIDTVVHLVAINREQGRITFDLVNHQGTVHLVEAAKAAGASRFIQMSNLKAAADSPAPFLRSKGEADAHLRASGLNWTILQPSVVFGRGDEFINTLAVTVLLGPVVPLPGGGRTQFQPIALNDLARATAACLSLPETSRQSYELGGADVFTYREMIELVCATMGKRRFYVPMPLPILRPVVSIMDKLLTNPPATPGLLALLNVANYCDENAIEPVFGIRPTPMEGNIDFVNELTLGRFLSRAIGRAEFEGRP